MAYQSDYDGNWYDDPSQDPYYQQQNGGGYQSAPPTPYVQASRDPSQSVYHGLDYWQGQGQNPVDANGNLASGFSRVNNGYDYRNPNTDDPNAGTYQGYTGPMAPDYSYYEPAPVFDAPKFSWDKSFQAPSAEDALNDPGYQFRVNQGAQALQQSAAGRGVLRSGGTLKDLLSYGQNMASQEYGNVYDRRFGEYNTEYGQARDVFDRTYKGAQDTFQPRLLDWQTKMQSQQHAADLAYNRGWDAYTYGHPSATDIYQTGAQ